MTIDLTPFYQAMELDRARLSKQAERGWIIEQAAVTRHEDSGPTAVRRWIGSMMILLGRWMQGMPEAPRVATDTDAAH